MLIFLTDLPLKKVFKIFFIKKSSIVSGETKLNIEKQESNVPPSLYTAHTAPLCECLDALKINIKQYAIYFINIYPLFCKSKNPKRSNVFVLYQLGMNKEEIKISLNIIITKTNIIFVVPEEHICKLYDITFSGNITKVYFDTKEEEIKRIKYVISHDNPNQLLRENIKQNIIGNAKIKHVCIENIRIESSGCITNMDLTEFILSYYMDEYNNVLYIKPYSILVNVGVSAYYIAIMDQLLDPSRNNEIMEKFLRSMLYIFKKDRNLEFDSYTLINTDLWRTDEFDFYFTLDDIRYAGFFANVEKTRNYYVNPVNMLLHHRIILSYLKDKNKKIYVIKTKLTTSSHRGKYYYSHISFIDFYEINKEDYIEEIKKQFYMYKIKRIYYAQLKQPIVSEHSFIPKLGLITALAIVDTEKNHVDVDVITSLLSHISSYRSYSIQIEGVKYDVDTLPLYRPSLWFNTIKEKSEGGEQKLQNNGLGISAFFLMPSDKVPREVTPALVISSVSEEKNIENLCHSVFSYEELFIFEGIIINKLGEEYYYEFYIEKNIEEINIAYDPPSYRGTKIKINRRTYVQKIIITFKYEHVSGEPIEYKIVNTDEGSNLYLTCKGEGPLWSVILMFVR